MSISTSDIAGIQEALKSPSSTLATAASGVLPGVKDPIGAVLSKTMTSINSLSASISTKLTKLEEDIVKSLDKTGKVKLVNGVIIVTIEPADAAKLPQYQAKIQGDINKLNNTVNKLKVVTATLKTVSDTAKLLQKAVEAQEIMLTIGNPVAKATMILIKKAIQILFYQDVLKEYVNIVSTQVANTEQALSEVLTKFSRLSVQFVVNSDANKGVVTSPEQAQTTLSNRGLGSNDGSKQQEFTNDDGRQFILGVEPYGTRELIGRARDKYSNLLVAETTPSFYSTPEQLLEELKTILNQ
jgi:hypothetical protein